MILPTEYVRLDGSLLGIGADLLRLLQVGERTVSSLWETFSQERLEPGASKVSFEWFVLALDFLFTADAIELSNDRIRRIS